MGDSLFVLNSGELSQLVFSLFIPFIRVAAFIAVMPLFGSQMVTARVRLLLAVILALTVSPVVGVAIPVEISIELMLIVMQEFLIGLALGFVVVVFFHIFALAGQLLALQMGLGFASMIDPANGVSVPIISQFFTILVGLVFLAFGGHLVTIEAMIESFRVIPPGSTWSYAILAENVFSTGSWLFASAMLMALPAVTAVLIVNIAFGVMTRSAPQLNIFSLGFPFTLVFGVFILWVSLQGFLYQYSARSLDLFEIIQRMLS